MELKLTWEMVESAVESGARTGLSVRATSGCGTGTGMRSSEE